MLGRGEIFTCGQITVELRAVYSLMHIKVERRWTRSLASEAGLQERPDHAESCKPPQGH